MKNNVINLGTIEFQRVIRKVEIAGEVFEVSAIISAENSISYLQNIGKGLSPRAAFCTFVLTMHSEAQKKKTKDKAQQVFNAMNDNEALAIMQIIVSTNTDDPCELWKADIQDIYDRFEVFIREYIYLSTREMVKSINNLAETMMKHIASRLTLSLAEFELNLSAITTQMAATIKSSLSQFEETAIKYFNSRTKLDPVMGKFGWGGLSVIPGHIIQYINANESELSTATVDEIMQDYYSYKNYENLDSMIVNWWKNPYFMNRKHALSEAVECYKHNLHIACITLCTTQTEGVIKSFLYDHYNKEFNNSTSFQKLIDLMDTCADKNITYLYECSLDTIEVLRKRFTEVFHLSNVEEASNLSRHKIAHGQMYEEVSKSDVLKTILYLDEVNRLLNFLKDNFSD